MTRIFTILLVAVFSVPMLSQSEPESFCGTTEVDPWLNEYFANRSLYMRESNDPVYVPLTIHILGTDEGTGYYPIHTLYESLCTLNDDFTDAQIQFYIQEPIRYINRTEWYDHPGFQAGIQMMQQNNVPGTANCYIVANPAGNCGYYAGSGNAIALSKGCTDPSDHTWAHELGHFFSLPHTFVGWEGIRWQIGSSAKDYEAQVRREIETVTGSNCQIASDRFCDTPPDYLSYRWSCNGNFQSNEVMLDPDSAQFRSDGSLFMSYANDACMNRFSFEQIEAMRANIQTRRPELFKSEFPDVILDRDVPLVAYPSDSIIVNPVGIIATWDSVPNATHYIIELSRLPNFAFILSRERITRTSYEFPELRPGIRYYWRVKAVNSNSFCTPFSQTHVFLTSSLSATSNLFENGSWNLSRQVYSSAEPLSMWFDVTEGMNPEWRIVNINGAMLYGGHLQVQHGRSFVELPIPDLMPGHYFIQLLDKNGLAVRRFIVN